MTRIQSPTPTRTPLPDLAELLSTVFAGAAPPRSLEALLDWMERRT